MYSFNPKTGIVRALADNFGHVNGVSFSPDYKKAYLFVPFPLARSFPRSPPVCSFHLTDLSALVPSFPSSADTGAANGTVNAYRPATLYSFDVETTSSGAITLENRKFFAYVDTGVPDGIKVDTSGNVYSGCGDGVHVWNPEGEFLGKIFLGDNLGSANLAFAGEHGLVILAETRIYLAKFGAGETVQAPGLWKA